MLLNEAVNDCIKEGILEEFLRKNRSEVIAMSIFEYNKDEEERQIRKAEYEAGVVDGEHRVFELVKHLIQDGRSDEISQMIHDK